MPAAAEGEGFGPGEALGMGLGEGVVLFMMDLSSPGDNWMIVRVAVLEHRLLRVSVIKSLVIVVGRTGINGIDRGQLRREHQGPNFKADQIRP